MRPDPHLRCHPTSCHVTSTIPCQPEALAKSPAGAFSGPLCARCSLSCFSSLSLCRARYACCTHGSAWRAAGGSLSAPSSARGGPWFSPSPGSRSRTGLACASKLVSDRRPSGPAGWQKWFDHSRCQHEADHSRAPLASCRVAALVAAHSNSMCLSSKALRLGMSLPGCSGGWLAWLPKCSRHLHAAPVTNARILMLSLAQCH